MDKINKRLKEFREKKGLSRSAFAKILDCSASTLQNIENGEYGVKTNYLTNLANKFPNEINYNEWLTDAAEAEIRRDLSEPDNEYRVNRPLTSAQLENDVSRLLKLLDETFETPKAKIEIAELMLKMVQEEKKKLDS